MGIMVYSLLWVMQDFVHQPNYRDTFTTVIWMLAAFSDSQGFKV